MKKQECIPVGCIPPTSVGAIRVTTGGLDRGRCLPYPLSPPPLSSHTSPPPCPERIWDQAARQKVTYPLAVDRQTGVKTLPYLKLSLRVVIRKAGTGKDYIIQYFKLE